MVTVASEGGVAEEGGGVVVEAIIVEEEGKQKCTVESLHYGHACDVFD